MKISKVVIVINRSKLHAEQTAKALKAVLDRERVQQEWVETLPPQRDLYRRLGDLRNKQADLVIACGGDGTLLQAFVAPASRFWASTSAILDSSLQCEVTGFERKCGGCSMRNSLSASAPRLTW